MNSTLMWLMRLTAAACLIVLMGCGSAVPSPTPTLMVLPTSLPGGATAPLPTPIPGTSGGASVYDVIAAHPDLTRMTQYFDLTGLTATLEGPGPLTVFAISDATLSALPNEWWRDYSTDPLDFFGYYIVPGSYLLDALMQERLVMALQGDPISANMILDSYMVRDAQIVQADLQADNGVVHIIDNVLAPIEDFRNPGPATILQTLAADGRFGTLIGALDAAGLAAKLDDGGVYTLFAPTDDAFTLLPPEHLQALYANPQALKTVLLQHIVLGEVTGSEVQAMAEEGAATITAASGEAPGFTLDADLPAIYTSGLLMVGGQAASAPPAHIVQADIRTSNGVIHMVDSLVLPTLLDPLPAAGQAGETQAGGDIMAVLTQDGRFGRFVALIEQAGYADTLRQAGPYTVFAPPDDAMALLSESDLAFITSGLETLGSHVLYHITTPDYEMVDFPDLIAAMGDTSAVSTLSGVLLPISMSGRGFVLGDPMYPQAHIIEPDIEASNGVIHVIDQFLKMPGMAYP